MTHQLKTEVIKQLLNTDCLKFGQFELKSGITSKVYVNLRELTRYPPLFKNVVDLISNMIPKENSNEWCPPIAISGVPYGAVPLGGAVAFACGLAYHPIRKEIKTYGCKTDSGHYSSYIVLEDVMSTGSSIIETLEKLPIDKVTDVIVIVNRELGGKENIQAKFPNVKVHSVFTLDEIISFNEKSSTLS